MRVFIGECFKSASQAKMRLESDRFIMTHDYFRWCCRKSTVSHDGIASSIASLATCGCRTFGAACYRIRHGSRAGPKAGDFAMSYTLEQFSADCRAALLKDP